jgi:topoisomerase-4 subunit A
MIRRFEITEVQAEAILNMRLRQLRKLEEIEIRKEHDALNMERAEIESLLGDEPRRWKAIATEIRETGKQFGPNTELGRRRTGIGEAPPTVVVPLEAMIEREPITVVCSEKGWIRTIRGHVSDISEIRYKEGDRGRFVVHAQTTDKVVIFATNGRFYTLGCDRLPGGRGQGEPLRLMIDLPDRHEPVVMMVHVAGRRLLVASDKGRGFVVEENEVIAQTRNGKQVLNLGAAEEAAACAVVGPGSDSVAVIGSNRKLLIFPLGDLPVMTRGRGVILQRYTKGEVSDLTTFIRAEGLSWRFGSGLRTETDLATWSGKRGQAGQKVPRGFPLANRFT